MKDLFFLLNILSARTNAPTSDEEIGAPHFLSLLPCLAKGRPKEEKNMLISFAE